MSISSGRPRGRTPGRSPMRPRVSCGQEPPKDLLELRRTHPGVRWGGNVPEKRRYEEEEIMPPMDSHTSSLPTAYLEATRGNGYGRDSGTYTRPTAPPTSGRRSNSAATTTRRRGSLASNGLASFGAKAPWKSGPSRWDKGQASGMSGLFSAPAATEKRGRRTRSPTQSAGPSSRPSTPTPSTRKVFTCSSSQPNVVPGFSPFQCTAGMPEKKVRRGSIGRRAPRGERGVYSTAPTRRTPSPRPYATRSELRTSSPKTVAPPDHSDKMIAALANRTHQLNITAAMGDQLFDNADQAGILPQRHPLQHQQLMQSVAEQSAITAPEEHPSVELPNEQDFDDSFGWSPIHWAAEKGSLVVLEGLLSRGADPDQRLPDGRTAFDIACSSLECAALKGESTEEVEERQQICSILQKEMNKAASKRDEESVVKLDEDPDILGAEVFRPLLKVLPRQAWDSILSNFPENEMRRITRTCKGMRALAAPKLMLLEEQRLEQEKAQQSGDLDLAVHLLNQLRFEVNLTEEPPIGVLHILQLLCIAAGGQFVDICDTWPVVKYLLRSGEPIDKLIRLGERPNNLTFDQAKWLLELLDLHANEMSTSCDDLLGAILTLVICLLDIVVKTTSQLPALRLPEGFIMPTKRELDKQYIVTNLKTI